MLAADAQQTHSYQSGRDPEYDTTSDRENELQGGWGSDTAEDSTLATASL
jgi:hypothetical protein